MKPKVLVLITSDPRTSGRPAEAIRIAAGVGTWKKADVSVYLGGSAVACLGEYVDELIEEDNFTRYLPIVREWGRPVWVEAGSVELAQLGEASVPFAEIGVPELAEQIAQATYVLRF